MKKLFLSIAVFVMALCANAQTNQYFWYQGNLMMGNPIAQIDSVTFGNNELTDTLHILLPRTIIKEVHDTIYITKYNCVPEGALSGEFSVSATKKVRFSKGNLQYQASTGLWRFAEEQYDYVGSDNSNISSTYSGWIDLYSWGTGNNPTNTSNSNGSYSTFVDWGVNPISNGGNEANAWRTLSIDEWMFLFCERTNAATLFGSGSVNGINGVVILPDNWILPSGCTFKASTSMGLSYTGDGYFNNTNADNFSHNSYTLEQWLAMEKAGAIFLPAAGARGDWKVTHQVGYQGCYWSATPRTSSTAYHFYINSEQVIAYDDDNRYDALSVRLVQDVE